MTLTTVKNSEDLPLASKLYKRVIFFGDVHLLHPNTPTFVIAINLLRMINLVIGRGQVDAIYILGDLFDERGSLDSDSAHDAIDFLNDVLWLCKKHNIRLVCLEGTPKHDRKQSRLLLKLNKAIGADVEYFDDLTVYKDKRLDMVVGLVPDEYRTDAKETTKLFKELMTSKGYSQVDMCGMHGFFEFQIPHIQSIGNFDSRVWQKMVKYGIYINHDHNPKMYGKIRVNGSPDVLTHGEVGVKGITVADFKDDGVDNYFVINHSTCPYLTVSGEGKTDEEIVKEVEATIKKLKSMEFGKHGRMRVTYPHDSDVRPLIRSLSEKNDVEIQATRLTDKNKIRKVNEIFASKSQDDIHLDPPTITRLLKERVGDMPLLDKILNSVEERL